MSEEKVYELKKCPFCGSTAQVWNLPSWHNYVVECDNENCGCAIGYNMSLDFDEVIKKWNNRKK